MTFQVFGTSMNGRTVTVTVGETIEIRLPENPTTGFRWQLMANDGAICAVTADRFEAPAPRALGRGGEHSWLLKALRIGECDVELRCRRRWANSLEPEESFSIHIQVGGSEHGT
jgi:inhibitor of cysteine peptidase